MVLRSTKVLIPLDANKRLEVKGPMHYLDPESQQTQAQGRAAVTWLK